MKVVNALVACSDLTGYIRLAKSGAEEQTFRLLNDFAELTGDIIEGAGGQVIKFMGDAALILFTEEKVNEGITALLRLQREGDEFLAAKSVSCRQHIRAHYGPVVIGELGTRTDKRIDVLGANVNAMFLLKTSGFTITPEVFRKLNAHSRTYFKKHTPPITYIPTGQPHRD